MQPPEPLSREPVDLDAYRAARAATPLKEALTIEETVTALEAAGFIDADRIAPADE